MKFNRSACVILHPTSLPGPDGIGDLGPEAYRWVNFLSESGVTIWQVLPLGPTGYGDSPYQCFSAFAGNPFLISPALLLDEGLLSRTDLADRPQFPVESVDFGPVINWKLTVLNRAVARFGKSAPAKLKAEFITFQQQEAEWLDDFALFMAIKEDLGGGSWGNWPLPMRKREPQALEEFKQAHAAEILNHKLRQFLFYRQWKALKTYANQKGIQIFGDVPIFVAYDSADAWSHPELFFINTKGQPTVIAGVPPDYFSPTGQRWGNPLYRWSIHKKTGYAWWISRMKSALGLFDLIRLDHFRGFAAYWEVPAHLPTAEFGRWVPGPGKQLFTALQKALGELPIIAEDLGRITADVLDIRDSFGFPGMKILQFSFGADSTEPFLPHNYPQNCVAYTGTHDNDTTIGWYLTAPEAERDFCRRYLGRSGEDIAWDMIRAIWSSVAVIAGTPMQDLLSLSGEARMNFPGRPSGNWAWRMPPGCLTDDLKARLKEINFLYRRLPGLVDPPLDD